MPLLLDRSKPAPGLPPGPPLPIAVQTPLLWLQRSRYLPALRRRYGDVFTIRAVPSGTLVVVADPDLVAEVFRGPTTTFHAGEGNDVLGVVLGRRSVLLLDEDEHLAERKLMLPAFHGRRIQAVVGLMEEMAREEARRWPVGEPFAMHRRMQELTLAIIVRVVFGVQDRAQAADLAGALRAAVSLRPWHLPAFAEPRLLAHRPWRRLRDDIARADALIHAQVARTRAAGGLDERDDVLSMLLTARSEAGEPVDDGWLRDQLMTLLLAGHETTAASLAWAFERLLRTPAALARLEEGLDEDKDPYREAVVKETLRARPVIHNVARRLTEPVELGGWRLPAGTVVMPAIGLLHEDDRLHADAAAFRPERWLEDGAGSAPYTWIPFGGGTRRCLGATFAQTEMDVVLRTVLREVELTAPDPRPETPRMAHITAVPSRGGRVAVVRRRAQSS